MKLAVAAQARRVPRISKRKPPRSRNQQSTLAPILTLVWSIREYPPLTKGTRARCPGPRRFEIDRSRSPRRFRAHRTRDHGAGLAGRSPATSRTAIRHQHRSVLKVLWSELHQNQFFLAPKRTHRDRELVVENARSPVWCEKATKARRIAEARSVLTGSAK